SNPGSDPDGDVAYIAHNAADAPLANLYLSRSGDVYVIAAGATNTNGAGSAPWPGGCPDDSMNTHAIGIEGASQGTGEAWPIGQQVAYTDMCAALCAAYSIDVDHVRAHFEWAPDRKIDPAGQSMYASGASSWDMGVFRDDVLGAAEPEPVPIPPPIPQEDDDMAFIIINRTTGQPALVYGDGRLTGLAGADLGAYVARFGEPIETDDVVFNDMASKG